MTIRWTLRLFQYKLSSVSPGIKYGNKIVSACIRVYILTNRHVVGRALVGVYYDPPPPPPHNFHFPHYFTPNNSPFHYFLPLYFCSVFVLFSASPRFNYLAPGGGCEVLFSPGRSVCLSVCVCVYLCVRPIFWYFISRLLEEISI